MLVRRTQPLLHSLSPMTFPSPTKALFSLQPTKTPDRSTALQSIAIIVFLKQLSRPWTCQLHPTCSSNIFNLAVKVFFHSQSPFNVMLRPTWNAHFSCTFLEAIAHACLKFSSLLLGLEHFKMKLQVRPASQSAAALVPWQQVLRQWEFSLSNLMAPCSSRALGSAPRYGKPVSQGHQASKTFREINHRD